MAGTDTIPSQDDEIDTANSASEPAAIRRVLIADPNPTLRKILRHMLAKLDLESTEAKDGQEALDLARQRPTPDAIILSLDLPVIDGYETCRQLKADELHQLTPIMVITTEDSAEEKMKAVEAGADDFLKRPINRAELMVRVRSLLRIHKFNSELTGAESVALALARAVAAKDGYANRHLEEVANYAVKLGKYIGLETKDLKIIRYGAILHNVGKIAIPDSVLEKTGPLTPREMAMFQQHPRVGCDICAPLKPLQAVLPIIRHHKEHWDGTGFPDGLRGNDIPLGAQIIGIVDTYAALVSDRPYRKAVGHDEAIRGLREQVRRGWRNPKLVDDFIAHLEEERAADPEFSQAATKTVEEPAAT